MSDFDVAIIGSGPAGSITAYLLTEAGYDVVIKNRLPSEPSQIIPKKE